MISVDRYLSRVYHPQKYNCAHLVCEVWGDLKGPQMEKVLRGFLCGWSDRRVRLSDLRHIRMLEKPEDPCVVLMQDRLGRHPHVGVWIRGKVLHCAPNKPTMHQDFKVATAGFHRVRFFTC